MVNSHHTQMSAFCFFVRCDSMLGLNALNCCLRWEHKRCEDCHCTLMGGCGPGGGGGTSSVLRIQKGNSFTMLVPYDLETVTRNRYLTKQIAHELPARWHACNHALKYIHRTKGSLGPIWDHLKLLCIERLTASSFLFCSTYTEVCTQGICAAMLRGRSQVKANSGNIAIPV